MTAPREQLENLRRILGETALKHWDISVLVSLCSHLVAENERMREALALVLPMAKGYAAEHPVGNNDRMIASAEAALTPPVEPTDSSQKKGKKPCR